MNRRYVQKQEIYKYINIKVWKLRKEISEVEIEECMNLDIDI